MLTVSDLAWGAAKFAAVCVIVVLLLVGGAYGTRANKDQEVENCRAIHGEYNYVLGECDFRSL